MKVCSASACTIPGFLSPSAIRSGGRAPVSCLSAGICVLLKAREVWLHVSCVCLLILYLCTQFNDPSLNNGHQLIFHLYQQDGLVNMGATGWVSATRHPPVKHMSFHAL